MTFSLAIAAASMLALLLIFISGIYLVLLVLRWLLDPFGGESPLEHLNEGDPYDDD
jgi:hypothetical protein